MTSSKIKMHIPEWFKFTGHKKASPSPQKVPEVFGPPADIIPPHHQNIISRADWGAEPPYRPKPALHHPIKWLKLTFSTSTRRCNTSVECIKTVQDLQMSHINICGLDDIVYNFVIGGDCKVYEARGWHLAPDNEIYALEPWQHKFLDIAFVGDDKGYKLPPTYGMLRAAWQLIEFGVKHKYISETYKIL